MLRGAVGREGAEDAFQETFLAALRAYPKLRRRRQPARLAADDRPPQGDRPPPRQGPAAAAGRGGGEAAVERPRPRRAIWAAVGALPPKQRAAVTLRYASDLPHARDRGGARLLARGGAPQPARGTETTAKGAGMTRALHLRATRRARPRGGPARRRLHDRPTRRSGRCCWPRPARAWSGSACPTRTPTSCSSTWPTRVSPRVLEAPGRARRGAARARPLLRGQARPLRPAARLAAQQRLPAAGAAGDRRGSPTARPATTPRWRRSAGNERAVRAAGTACGPTRSRSSSPATASCAAAAVSAATAAA